MLSMFFMFYSRLQFLTFSLGRTIRARAFGWGFVAILATVALVSTRLVLETQPHNTHKTTATRAQKHLIDYSIQELSLWRSSLDGTTRNHLSAKSLIHYRDDLSSVLEQPLLIAESSLAPNALAPNPVKHQNIINTLSAKQAHLRNEGESIEFEGDVHVVRQIPNTPNNVLSTDLLTVLPDSSQVFTPSAVTLTQGDNTVTSSTGINYTHNDAVLQLNGAVHAILLPFNPLKNK
jgi:LPS export ABC transporter protein LptC